MSVSTFIRQMYESDIDFGNVNVDDFIVCVKRLNQILSSACDDSRKSVRKRKFNSLLSNQVYLSERFNPKIVHDYYSYTCRNVQIDVVIRGCYGVSVIGWIPDVEELCKLYNFRKESENDLFSFDYLDKEVVKNYVNQTSHVWYFFGDKERFGVNEKGLDNIVYIWKLLIEMSFSRV